MKIARPAKFHFLVVTFIGSQYVTSYMMNQCFGHKIHLILTTLTFFIVFTHFENIFVNLYSKNAKNLYLQFCEVFIHSLNGLLTENDMN